MLEFGNTCGGCVMFTTGLMIIVLSQMIKHLARSGCLFKLPRSFILTSQETASQQIIIIGIVNWIWSCGILKYIMHDFAW